jgi:sugar O-acyltransferase (sialic acid O-acetyltransferase NeuD family)
MKNLIIIGARGFGREVYSLSKSAIGCGKDFVVKGFLDDNSMILDGFCNYPPILSSVEEYEVQENDVFICAIGAVKWKIFYTKIIMEKKGRFVNLIHKSAIIRDNVSLGYGIIIGENCIISNEVVIKDFVTIHSYCIIGHDAFIGANTQIGAQCFIGGFAIIENDATLNVKATVLDRLKIQTGATVGAASLVIKNVKANTTVFGIPATVLKF